MGASITSDSPFPPREPVQTRAERRALEVLERERKEEADARTTLWSFIWTIFAFKIVTMLVILYVAAGSSESIAIAFATTWYWFIIPVIAIAGPLLCRWRLVTQRRRRQTLRKSEWMVDPEPPPPAHGTGPEPGGFDPDRVQIVFHHPGDEHPLVQ